MEDKNNYTSDISVQNSTQIDVKKKVWVTPVVEIISQYDVNQGNTNRPNEGQQFTIVTNTKTGGKGTYTAHS